MDQQTRDKYTVVIGLEVHAQLATATKQFVADANTFGNDPNTNISAITLAHPGTLPRLNKKSVEYGIRLGLALGSEISRYQIFDRKNYFYPDLPKGYQLTQDHTPICVGGIVAIKLKDGSTKDVQLNRVHLEEDAGKSIHDGDATDTLVDYNRAGVPLVEIVTDPVMRSSEEAAAFMGEIRKLVRYLEICDGNMEEGSLRCDANVSIMLNEATEFGQRVEIKNMNSIRNVQRAIDYEVERQVIAVEAGERIISETRTFDADKGKTFSMREKEQLTDYRYFPDPDLSPLEVTEEWLQAVAANMPPLPHALYKKFTQEYGLPEYDAQVLTEDKAMALYFDALGQAAGDYKTASNWVMGPVKGYLNDQGMGMEEFPLHAGQLAGALALVAENKVSHTAATQQLFPAMLQAEHAGKTAAALAEALNLLQESDADSLLAIIEEVLAANPAKVKEYRKGKKGLIGMFMGQVMKKTGGKADPKKTNKLLAQKLNEA